ncbi:hypothetical protein NEISUBOT_05675, partial [Neisseria subflava NJ9703]
AYILALSKSRIVRYYTEGMYTKKIQVLFHIRFGIRLVTYVLEEEKKKDIRMRLEHETIQIKI